MPSVRAILMNDDPYYFVEIDTLTESEIASLRAIVEED